MAVEGRGGPLSRPSDPRLRARRAPIRCCCSCTASPPARTTGALCSSMSVEHAVAGPRLPRLRALVEAARSRLQPSLASRPGRGAACRRRRPARAVFIVAHDMGTSVATELMARDLEGRLGHRARRRAAVQRQHRPGARQPDARSAAAAQPARRALRPAQQRARLPPPVRRALLGRAPARPRGGRRSVVADLPQRRAHPGPPADPLPRRARALRRALARRGARLGRAPELRLGPPGSGGDDRRPRRADRAAPRRAGRAGFPSSGTTRSSRIRRRSSRRFARALERATV